MAWCGRQVWQAWSKRKKVCGVVVCVVGRVAGGKGREGGEEVV